ncbi:hypothetical protein MAPG_09955 [Magnaporthiopsis poae ATCC 64411]|uniref:ATP-binding protein n=1 Tax=Magnaporthiopsis poae (strain ATCC 64411 / 73-15) TaxID=644358 RepID=A0A0C4EBA8_MAGP6|nr:hypothetical protein MAPG_09955 [Magnaporthiopsis poae ATCC 64411]
MSEDGSTAARPKLFIQMSGAPGAGKSSMARLLQQSIGGLVIDHDVVRSSLLQSTAGLLPFDHVAKTAYGLHWALADSAMQQGLAAVIMDSTCNSPEVVDRGAELAARHGYIYWYVECMVTDVDLLDRRLRARERPMASQRTAVDEPPAAAASARAGEDSRALFRRWIDSPCRPSALDRVIVVDSSADLEEGRDLVLQKILPGVEGR